jgi:hypothetical protein
MVPNIPDGWKIDQMVIKYNSIFHCKTIQKVTQIGIFGLKIYHLATLPEMSTSTLDLLSTGRATISRLFSSGISGYPQFFFRDRCCDFLNIFAKTFSKKIGIFDSKQS